MSCFIRSRVALTQQKPLRNRARFSLSEQQFPRNYGNSRMSRGRARLCRLLSRTSLGDRNIREGERVLQLITRLPFAFPFPVGIAEVCTGM